MKSRHLIRLRWYHKMVLMGCSLLLAILIIELAGRALDLLPHTTDSLFHS